MNNFPPDSGETEKLLGQVRAGEPQALNQLGIVTETRFGGFLFGRDFVNPSAGGAICGLNESGEEDMYAWMRTYSAKIGKMAEAMAYSAGQHTAMQPARAN